VVGRCAVPPAPFLGAKERVDTQVRSLLSLKLSPVQSTANARGRFDSTAERATHPQRRCFRPSRQSKLLSDRDLQDGGGYCSARATAENEFASNVPRAKH
jgi:hypothetical protein